MPRPARKGRSSRTALTQNEAMRILLEVGSCYECTDPDWDPNRPVDPKDRHRPPWTDEQIRETWQAIRDEIMEETAEQVRNAQPGFCAPRLRPWGWWVHDSTEPRDRRITEAEQLRRMGIEVPPCQE